MKIILCLFISFFCYSAAAEEPAAQKTEQLTYFIPKGFRIIHQDENAKPEVVEIISEAESLDNWSRMITIQTFSDSDKYDAESYVLEVARLAKQLCGKVQVEPVATARQNGFVFSHKVIMCEPNLKTSKPEIINIKAIKGKESFYVVQVTNRVEIDNNEIRYWALYMRDTVIERK